MQFEVLKGALDSALGGRECFEYGLDIVLEYFGEESAFSIARMAPERAFVHRTNLHFTFRLKPPGLCYL